MKKIILLLIITILPIFAFSQSLGSVQQNFDFDQDFGIGLSKSFGEEGYGVAAKYNEWYFSYDNSKITFPLFDEHYYVRKYSILKEVYSYKMNVTDPNETLVLIGVGYNQSYDLYNVDSDDIPDIIPYIGFGFKEKWVEIILILDVCDLKGKLTFIYKL